MQCWLSPHAHRRVFEAYDPEFEALSLDEAALDVTDHCAQHGVKGARGQWHWIPEKGARPTWGWGDGWTCLSAARECSLPSTSMQVPK